MASAALVLSAPIVDDTDREGERLAIKRKAFAVNSNRTVWSKSNAIALWFLWQSRPRQTTYLSR